MSVWYGISVTATGGDWDWPSTWTHLLARFAAGDFTVNAPFAVSLPAVLVQTGMSTVTVAGVATAVALVSVMALRKARPCEAGSAACLIGLALSPHAWAYDAVLALPMIALAATTLTEPARTRLLLGVALAAPLFFASRQLGFDPLAFVVIGGTVAWIAFQPQLSQAYARAPWRNT
jgi:hypothetical protein